MEELFDTYNKILPDVLSRIIEFKSVWNEADEKSLFQELAFCILTPQSKAQNAWKTIKKLTETRKLFEGNSAAIAEDMNLVRFRNNKAGYIVRAREIFFYNSKENAINKINPVDFFEMYHQHTKYPPASKWLFLTIFIVIIMILLGTRAFAMLKYGCEKNWLEFFFGRCGSIIRSRR